MMKKILVRLLMGMLPVYMLLCICTPISFAAGEIEDLQLTDEELAYVQTRDTLRVGYVQDRIPISFQNEDGELGGVCRAIFDRIQQISGLKFEYVALPNGPVTYEMLLEGGFDLITSVEYNQENQHANGILISNPYLSSRKVVVARNDLVFRQDAPYSVAISLGSQTIKKVLTKAFPNFTVVDYDSVRACFDAVNSGEVDLVIQNQYVAEYWLYKPAYDNLKAMPVLGLEDQSCFSAVVAFGDWEGPSPEDGELLIGILNKAIARLTEDEVASYTIQGVLENPYNFTFSDLLYRYRYTIAVLGVAALLIIGLAALLFRLRTRALADQADAKARGQFLSTMSHEIRTPLNGLIGLNYLMSQRLDDRKRLESYLRQSTITAQYLLSLVNDILDMSKLQEHRMELMNRPVDLELLFSTVKDIVSTGMADKRLNFQADTELAYPCVLGDEVRIQQVLLNLLDNARKFTPEGGQVTLTVRQERCESGDILTRAEVTDTGRGMSEEFQQHIFDTFAQELDTVSKGNQGTGLGLPISRSLAKLMGGDLSFTSTKGQGSSFCFTFPGQPAQLPQAKEPAPVVEKIKPRIIVAEDNELNSEIMLELLENAGYEAVPAKDGREALECFEQSEPGTYGVILMDILMPEMDGFQACAAIRALERPDAKRVRIIACTANSFAQDREKARQSGMDDFLPKPVDIDELMKKLEAWQP